MHFRCPAGVLASASLLPLLENLLSPQFLLAGIPSPSTTFACITFPYFLVLPDAPHLSLPLSDFFHQTLLVWIRQQTMAKSCSRPWFRKERFIGSQLSPLVYVVFISAFSLQWQTLVVETETIWLAKLKYLFFGPLEKMFANLWSIPSGIWVFSSLETLYAKGENFVQNLFYFAVFFFQIKRKITLRYDTQEINLQLIFQGSINICCIEPATY